MKNNDLNSIFNYLYDRNTIIVYDSDDNEVESVFFYSRCLQCAIFLMQELGERTNNYKFSLMENGNIYSEELNEKIMEAYLERNNKNISEITLPENVQYVADKLKKVFAENESCPPVKWVELLATICYLKHYVMIYKTSVEDVCAELKKRNTGFDNDEQNKRAIKTTFDNLLF